MGKGRAAAGVVVSREREHATEPGGAGGIGVLEHVAAAVHARPLAVPHAVDAVVLRAREHADLLRAPDRGGGEILVHAGLELDVAALEVFLRAPQRLVQAAERRAARTRDESRSVQARALVAFALEQQQPDQRLCAGHENSAALDRVLVFETRSCKFHIS